jgi:putative transposase
MPNYRRSRTAGGTWFFTLVTYRRRPLLTMPQARKILRTVVAEVRHDYPFTIDGWVLLPDHMHCVWTLPVGDDDYSKRWGLITARFTQTAKTLLHREDWMNASKEKHREGSIWQRRFWEHAIRDNADYARHMEYLHYNPVKHGLVQAVGDWPFSTFRRCVREGIYEPDWAGVVGNASGGFGE